MNPLVPDDGVDPVRRTPGEVLAGRVEVREVDDDVEIVGLGERCRDEQIRLDTGEVGDPRTDRSRIDRGGQHEVVLGVNGPTDLGSHTTRSAAHSDSCHPASVLPDVGHSPSGTSC